MHQIGLFRTPQRGDSTQSTSAASVQHVTRWLLLAVGVAFASTSMAQDSSVRVALSGHVLPALAQALVVPRGDASLAAAPTDQPITLTVVLRRSDPDGFTRFLNDVYDQNSPQFRQFLTPAQVTERFGPTRADYDAVIQYFTQRGFTVGEGSDNRMTLTLNGTRASAASALLVNIADYRIGDKYFYANDVDPTLPADIASRVEAVIGLNSLAAPAPNYNAILEPFCRAWAWANSLEQSTTASGGYVTNDTTFKAKLKTCMTEHHATAYANGSKIDPPPPAWQGADGTGQTIGVVAFDTYLPSDVSNYIAAIGLPAAKIADVTQVHVNGGATPGANQSEVLLDIDTILADARGAKIVVFDATFTGGGSSFQSVFNAMISANVNIITNSWAYCEDQTTLADVQSIDTILQTAAASGISAFSGSGDHGSTCLDGKPNTVHVPASSPHITAVGGTSLTLGPGYTYGIETWWNGSSASPPTGQGGFGVSVFFPRPSYQNGLNAAANRSIPDVAANADPAQGMYICQASAGGCPSGLLYGGTSRSAPAWAAFGALLNQTQGSNLGFLNPLLYPLSATDSFHNAASMTSDFVHVGLGSPNLARLHLHLTSQTAGAVDTSVSDVTAYSALNEAWTPNPEGTLLPIFADGTSPTFIVVSLADALGNTLSGRTVTLTGTGSAVITPASGVTTSDNGAIIFKATDTAFETVIFTATVNPGNIVLTQKPNVEFIPPYAANASISAGPPSVPNNGVSITTITVTLQDALGRPSPGKHIALSQGPGNSVVSGPNPSITGAAGTIQFTATDHFAETVTYTAIDVSDGNLPVPGSAIVTFGGQANSSCAAAPPAASAGYTLTPFITGFAASTYSYGNINFGCSGASLPAFASDGSVYAYNQLDGSVFKLPSTGGSASSTTKLSTLGSTLHDAVVGKDGRLYATRNATTGNYFTGAIYELDPNTGAVLRNLLGDILCPNALTVDPLSGDLFYDDSCSGGNPNSGNTSIWRVSNPASATPTLSVYTTLPVAPPSSWLAFAPDGTLFVAQWVDGNNQPVLRISGTNGPAVPTQTPVPGLSTIFWTTVGEVLPNGAAKSLLVLDAASLKVKLADITTDPPTFTDLIDGPFGTGVIGPDGCVYISNADTIYKLAPAAGGCGFASTSKAAKLALAPAVVSPNPAQGSAQTFTATFSNVTVPAGTQVTFTIAGANPLLLQAPTNGSGVATITYYGAIAGTDTVSAFGFANGLRLTTNPVKFTWSSGKHVSFVGLSLSPTANTVCTPATLTATLSDASVTPLAAIVGETIHFTLGTQSCNAVTNVSGVAGCTISPTTPGQFTMTASYAGNATYGPSTASQGYVVPGTVAVVGAPPLPVCAASRKVQGAAGTFDLPLSPGP